MRYRKILISLAALCLALTMVSVARAEDAATLTITPDRTEIHASGEPVTVVYTLRVTPPAGKELGVFSIRLLPPEGMGLPDGSGGADEIWVNEALRYSNSNRGGVFRTFEYTPESRFFAAVGSSPDNRMKAEADVLSLTVTIPGGRYGAFAMGAEFVAAPDGSGASYTPVVVAPSVTVIGPDGTAAPSDTARPDGTASGVTAPTDPPQTNDTPAPDGVPADGLPGPAEDAVPGGTETYPGLTEPVDGGNTASDSAATLAAPRRGAAWPLWAALAVAAAAAAAVQWRVPGGWAGLFRKKDTVNQDTEGEGEQ